MRISLSGSSSRGVDGLDIVFEDREEYRKLLSYYSDLKLFCEGAYSFDKNVLEMVMSRVLLLEKLCTGCSTKKDGKLHGFLPLESFSEFMSLLFIVTGCFGEVFRSQLVLADALKDMKSKMDSLRITM